MAGTSEGSKKAADTRKKQDPKAFQKMGEQGAHARHDKSPEEESKIAREAAETRKKKDPHAFQKMGEKGGRSSGGGTSSEKEE
jgi:general stress protein YciG